MSDVIKKNGWTLVYEPNGLPVLSGEILESHQGDMYRIVGGRPPHKPSSSGFVYTVDNREFYPTVFDLKWVHE
jgi:hypothetical protein